MRCRTCYETITFDGSYCVDDIGSTCPLKTFAEILLDIAGIDTKSEQTVEFQYLCDPCVSNIKTCYEFIMRAKHVNSRLLQEFNLNDGSSFLEEPTIDLPNSIIKPDLDDYVSDRCESSIGEAIVKVEDTYPDPIVHVKAELNDKKTANTTKPETDDDWKEEIESDADDEEIQEPVKRKRGRPAKKKRSNRNENKCDICGKTFAWYKDMIRHARSHSTNEPEHKCEYCGRLFLRRDKMNDHMKTHFKQLTENGRYRAAKQSEWNFAKCLYAKPVLKLVQCKICNKEFSKIADLRGHILLHRDEELSKNDSQNSENNSESKEIGANIRSDFLKANYAPYYSIVNEYGYELSISDSDNSDFEIKREGEGAGETELPEKYKCMICNKAFNHQYEIFSHTLNAHLNSKLPLKCNVCKVQFLCSEMLQMHVRRQCKNKARKFQCRDCPGKFMWPENLEVHQCSHNPTRSKNDITSAGRRSTSMSIDKQQGGKAKEKDCVAAVSAKRTTRNLQCDQCDKTFIWPKDMTRHRRIHMPDRDKFQCQICHRTFNRKDNMTVHMKIHGEDLAAAITDNRRKDSNNSTTKPSKFQALDENLTRPHGCKMIECMICHSKQQIVRLSDLKVHLIKHQFDESYVERWQSVEKVAETLYPELGTSMKKDELVNRITLDLAAQHYDRFYSVTNEIGYELNLSSSETNTDTESDSEDDDNNDIKMHKRLKSSEKYTCEMCSAVFDRKFKLFKHQLQSHKWEDANYTCIHCNMKLPNSQLLEWHYKRQCKNNLKRFLCKKCPMRFMWKDNLEAHIRTSHLEKSIEKLEFCSWENYVHQSKRGKLTAAERARRYREKRKQDNERYDEFKRKQKERNEKRMKRGDMPRRILQRVRDKAREYTRAKREEKKAILEMGNTKTIRDPSSLKCSKCNRNFLMQKDLTRHILMKACSSEISELVKCLYCPRKFYRKENLLAHLNKHGIPSKSYANAECLLQSSNKPNGPKQIYCRVCNCNFQRIEQLRVHLLREANSAASQHYSFESPLNYAITNSLGFEMNINDDSETETEDDQKNLPSSSSSSSIRRQTYQCCICNLTANRKYEIVQHQLSMHKYEQLPFKCDSCVFRTVSQDILINHMRSQCHNLDKKYKCEICEFKFMWPENLNAHQQHYHVETKLESQNLSNMTSDQQQQADVSQIADNTQQAGEMKKPVIFQCDQCPCKYNRKDRLNAHIRKLHNPSNTNSNSNVNENSINNDDDTTTTTAIKKRVSRKPRNNDAAQEKKKHPPEKKYLCAFCGRALTSSSNLIIHIRRHTGEKPYKCEFCQMAFPRSSDLLAHRRKHTGEKPHPCTICDKAFTRSYKLMLHMRTHTGERPHKCTYCEKSFTQSNDLTLHIRRHTGERPYVCGVCGERFIQGTALKNHRMMRGHYEDIEDSSIAT